MTASVKFFFVLGGHLPEQDLTHFFGGQDDDPLAGVMISARLPPIATDEYYHRVFPQEPITHRYALLTEEGDAAVPLNHIDGLWANVTRLNVARSVSDIRESQQDWWHKLDRFVSAMRDHVNDGDVLVIDISAGMRDVPLMLMISLMQLRVCFETLHLRLVTCGKLETGIVMRDVTRSFQVMEWALALAGVREQGDLRGLKALVADLRVRRGQSVHNNVTDPCWQHLQELHDQIETLEQAVLDWHYHAIPACLETITAFPLQIPQAVEGIECELPELLLLELALAVVTDCFRLPSDVGPATATWPLLNSGIFIERFTRWGRWTEAVSLATAFVCERAAWLLEPSDDSKNTAQRYERYQLALEAETDHTTQNLRVRLMALPQGPGLLHAFDGLQRLRHVLLHGQTTTGNWPKDLDTVRGVLEGVAQHLRAQTLIADDNAKVPSVKRGGLFLTLGDSTDYVSRPDGVPDAGPAFSEAAAAGHVVQSSVSKQLAGMSGYTQMHANGLRSSRETGDAIAVPVVTDLSGQEFSLNFVDQANDDSRDSSHYAGVIRRMIDAVQDGDRLILDLTHGLGDVPVTALGMVIFLRYVRCDVNVSLITYDNHTPSELLNLTPIRDLFTLAGALDVLRRGVNPLPLAAWLKIQQHGHVQGLGDDLEHLALALLTRRPAGIEACGEVVAKRLRDDQQMDQACQSVPGLALVLVQLKATMPLLLADGTSFQQTFHGWYHARGARLLGQRERGPRAGHLDENRF